MEELKRKLSDFYGGDILDIGTGTGDFIKILIESFKDYNSVIGIDIKEDSLEDARKKFKKDNIKFEIGRAEDLQYKNESFDTVSTSNVLHHLKNVSAAVNEIFRVLKKDGLFIVNEMYSDNQAEAQITHMLKHHISAEIDTILGKEHNKTLKKNEIINFINDKFSKIKYFDFIEEKDVIKNPEELKLIRDSLDEKLKRIQETEYYGNVKRKVDIIKKRLPLTGIKRPTQIVILARK